MNKPIHTSIDLSTTYLGMRLKNPLVASASPLSYSLDNIHRLQEAGVSCVVLFSLFEEQIIHESSKLLYHLTYGTEMYPEALSYYPKSSEYILGPVKYLEHLAKAKKAARIPVIGSLNGFTMGGWTKYAKHMEDAGADALELNIYFVPTNLDKTAQEVEDGYLKIFESVRSSVSIPIAVKLSPYFSSLGNMAQKLENAGADGLVLFNRFYQPDINLETLELESNILLSTPQAMRLPLRWTAILYGHVKCSLGATGGIHEAQDVLKMLMAGADCVMMCSALLKHGVEHARKVLEELSAWMGQHEYTSIRQMQGSMSQKSCANPEVFERAAYIKSLENHIYR